MRPFIRAWPLAILMMSSHSWAWGVGDFFDELRSPWGDPLSRGILIGGGGVSLGLKFFFRDSIVDPFQEKVSRKNQLKQYDRPIYYMGRAIPNLIYGVAMYGLGQKKGTEVMFKATIYSGLITELLKRVAQQPRPQGTSKLSFPSGHATAAFAFASVVGDRHSWPWGALAYGLAGLVAFQRLNSNAHFLHDVLAGATIGTTFGIGLNRLLDGGKTSPAKTYVLPLPGGVMVGHTRLF